VPAGRGERDPQRFWGSVVGALDGKVFVGDRCPEPATSVKGEQIDAWYCGKAHGHGGNVQAVMRPDGLPLWTGPAEPGPGTSTSAGTG
jgi:hypothetical protein